MEIHPYGNRWAILPSAHEVFFQLHVLDLENNSHIKTKPRITAPLAAWLDETCPGRWTTEWARIDSSTARVDKAILVEDEGIFHLFKLAWHDHPDIQRQHDLDQTFVYCPYIPLTITTPKVSFAIKDD